MITLQSKNSGDNSVLGDFTDATIDLEARCQELLETPFTDHVTLPKDPGEHPFAEWNAGPDLVDQVKGLESNLKAALEKKGENVENVRTPGVTKRASQVTPEEMAAAISHRDFTANDVAMIEIVYGEPQKQEHAYTDADQAMLNSVRSLQTFLEEARNAEAALVVN